MGLYLRPSLFCPRVQVMATFAGGPVYRPGGGRRRNFRRASVTSWYPPSITLSSACKIISPFASRVGQWLVDRTTRAIRRPARRC
jgi:hypothetical protein